MKPEVNKILGKFQPEVSNKTELESQKVELSADALQKEARLVAKNAKDANDKADQVRKEAYALLSDLRGLKKQLESISSLSSRYFDEANDIFAEAEKKYMSISRIKNDMKNADLDTSGLQKEMKSYGDAAGFAAEASDAAEGAEMIADEAINAIKSI